MYVKDNTNYISMKKSQNLSDSVYFNEYTYIEDWCVLELSFLFYEKWILTTSVHLFFTLTIAFTLLYRLIQTRAETVPRS